MHFDAVGAADQQSPLIHLQHSPVLILISSNAHLLELARLLQLGDGYTATRVSVKRSRSLPSGLTLPI